MKQFLKNISPFNNRTEMPTLLFAIKKVLAFWLCYITGIFIAEGLVILLHFVMGKNMLAGDVFEPQMISLITYYGYLIVIGAALIYWKIIEKKPLHEMGMTKNFSSYFTGIGAAVLLLAISVFAIIMTGSITYQGVFEKINIPVIFLFVGGFIVQGAAEEILCRGIVLHTLKEKTSLAAAIAISTVLFIIPHWSSLFAGKAIYGIIGILNLVFISIIFSLLTIHFKSIWAACGLHSFWNAILYSVLGLNLSGSGETASAIFNLQSAGDNIWNGSMYGIEASGITAIVLALAAMLIWVMNGKKT